MTHAQYRESLRRDARLGRQAFRAAADQCRVACGWVETKTPSQEDIPSETVYVGSAALTAVYTLTGNRQALLRGVDAA